MRPDPVELNNIHALVGAVENDDLIYVDGYLTKNLGIFLPVGGACGYAVTPEHTHPSYMFFLPFDDQSEVIVGKRHIYPKAYRLFCLSPGIPHHEVRSLLPPRYCAIFISKEYFNDKSVLYGAGDVMFRADEFTMPKRLPGLLKQFMQEYVLSKKLGSDLLDALAVQITHTILRAVFGIAEYPEAEIAEDLGIEQVSAYIENHCHEALTLTQLAIIAGMSISTLGRLFNQNKGMSPAAYVMYVRIERAKKLLRYGGLSITEIAVQCGFSTPSYFSKCFKAYTGESPRSFLSQLE